MLDLFAEPQTIVSIAALSLQPSDRQAHIEVDTSLPSLNVRQIATALPHIGLPFPQPDDPAEHAVNFSLDTSFPKLDHLLAGCDPQQGRSKPAGQFPLAITTRLPDPADAKYPYRLCFSPRVIYRDHSVTISSDTFDQALKLMVDIYNEETCQHWRPMPTASIPIAKLDAFGRAITTDWITPGGHQPPIVQEPAIRYPTPGLAGNLALWGLTPADLLAFVDERS